MSTQNQGKDLQNTILRIARTYQDRNVCKIHKVDPPVRVVGFGAARKVIFMPNPFVDFIGSWTERGGRSIALEAKSTAKPTLPILQSGGITEAQYESLWSWRKSGAAVGVLWEYGQEIRFAPLEALRAQLDAGVKHLKWDNATPVPRGTGFCEFDFMQVLRAYFP